MAHLLKFLALIALLYLLGTFIPFGSIICAAVIFYALWLLAGK